jgi:hypothetical protein
MNDVISYQLIVAVLVRAAVVTAFIAVLGRANFLEVFRSEKVLSWRLFAGAAVLWFTCEMLAAGRLVDSQAVMLLNFVEVLAFLGTAKVIASRFTDKPKVDTTEQPKPPADAPN